MKLVWIGSLMWAGSLFAGNQVQEINVNSRYTVESVELAGDSEAHISKGLRSDLRNLVGEKFNPGALDDLAQAIRKELHAQTVEHRVFRGTQPDHVKIVFEVTRKPTHFDLSIPKFLYHSKQGWSGAVEGTVKVSTSSFTAGLVSDRDELPERYAGVIARYENRRIGSDRVRMRFQFESLHDQWDRNTQEVAGQGDVPEIYRTRQSFEPVAAFVLARPLTLEVGTSFERFQSQFPAARTEAANAVVTTLRYHHRVEGSENQQDLDAGYSLRAATRLLESDYVYVRHKADFRWMLTHGRHVLIDDVMGGVISGRAPLFERFVVGNSSTLRGWNKFDLDPAGGNRFIHNTVEYRYRAFVIFYDTGSAWDAGQTPVARHSLGVGVRWSGFNVAVAFPVKDGRADPVFMMGLNY